MLIGGTNIIFGGGVNVVLHPRARLVFEIGIVTIVRVMRLISQLVTEKRNNSVIGVTSIATMLNSPNRSTCSTAGKTVVTFAGSTTGRLTSRKVHIGTITPNVMGARHFSRLCRRDNRGVSGHVREVTLNHLKAPLSITGTYTFLTSSHSSCVSKRVLKISNYTSVWSGGGVVLDLGRQPRRTITAVSTSKTILGCKRLSTFSRGVNTLLPRHSLLFLLARGGINKVT